MLGEHCKDLWSTFSTFCTVLNLNFIFKISWCNAIFIFQILCTFVLRLSTVYTFCFPLGLTVRKALNNFHNLRITMQCDKSWSSWFTTNLWIPECNRYVFTVVNILYQLKQLLFMNTSNTINKALMNSTVVFIITVHAWDFTSVLYVYFYNIVIQLKKI